MKIIESPIKGVFEIYPKKWQDNRGYFFESYRADILQESGIDEEWLQENQSFSKKGIVRGLHFQNNPFSQAKLVRVLSGTVLDVAVDLRKGSETFGKAFVKELNSEEANMLYIPAGFAHGFSVLEDAVFSYKCSNYFNKESEGGILWNDPELNIDWGVDSPVLSEKDQYWPTLKEFKEKSGGGL
ncbi:dTDP-4-dehydrorhamnose 3,5-epimerase [Indibacter alkaliphilus LW1]|jgi:dTDP-4-dehydrorhamnose 3,5-epimerase|uniref:dTDP-4-dehydrorhamnose 3,5-epimerase n=1 Tax=Indibacter alkaliphilus (strain CCUG 57479 / KCTC 22604 / LW1) TaxID=1189612 RepID=S2DBW6_INDAL|nr:dTDP-4-dehydrorhamnose 3,5-epimerase [Indibacter alkaliphilus]EOZ96672.1 dTDP-4-dehydrorhamnose 3,5-epimerase [Indibacter alkaliphilus LW1]